MSLLWRSLLSLPTPGQICVEIESASLHRTLGKAVESYKVKA
jgi:hypothetical protein